MDVPIKREICILLCHYLKQNNPEIYQKFAEFVEKQKLLPAGCGSVNEALNLRYESFSHDQFYEFIKSLRPKDDFPSIFRRIAPFEPPPVRSEEMAPIKRVYGHKKDIYCLEIDRLSRIIVTASDDCTIKVWSVPSIDPIRTFTGHEAVVTNISMNPMCSMVLSSSEDKTICLWSLESGKRIAVLGGFTSEIIHYAVFSPTGSMIAAACEDGTIPLWTTADALNSRPPIRTLRSPAKGAVGWITFSPGSEFIAFSAEPNSVVVTALKTLSQTNLELHQSLADRIQFSERYTSIGGELSPRLLTVAYEEGVAAIWCICNGQWKDKFVFRHHSGQGRRSSKINRVSWDCEEHLLVISKTNAVYVCDSINGEEIGQISNTAAAFENTTCIIGNPVKRELFFFANRSGACCLVDIFQLTVTCEFRVADDADFTDAVWDKNGEHVYAIDTAGAITVFKLCESKNNVQMIVTDCILSSNNSYYVDRQGKRLEKQPTSHDIRTCDIPLRFSQSIALRNSAIELKLIQRLISNERPTISQSQSAAIGPPPLHIRLSTEFPVNPHGKGSFRVPVEDEDEAEEEISDVHITSDVDDWAFVEKSDVEKNDENEEDDLTPPTFLITKSIRKGYWPDWTLAISYDESFFIPQLGDNHIFLKQPYIEVLQSIGAEIPESLDQFFTDDHQQEQQSTDSEHGQIIRPNSLSIMTPFMRRVTITNIEPDGQNILITISSQENNQFKDKILFPFPEKKKFFVHLPRFKTSMNLMNSLKEGSNVTYEARDEKGFIKNIGGVIISIKEDWNLNYYNSIELSTEDEKIVHISPWEIIKVDEKDVPYHDHALIFSAITSRIINLLEANFNDPKYNFLIGFPDPKNDPSIAQKVKMPMSISLMIERLESNWYRAFSGIKYDARLLQKDSICLYSENSPEAEIATSVFKSIVDNLDLLQKRMYESQMMAKNRSLTPQQQQQPK